MVWWEVIARLALAMVLGGLVGMQREFQRNAAGFRTHTLVALGSCVAMLTNEYLYRTYGGSSTDIARMGSYVISGIGFLGAGSIVKDGVRIRGLTTAAGLWVVACLGLAAGAGFYIGAGVGAVLVVMILTLMKTVEGRFMRKKERIEIGLQMRNQPFQMAQVLQVLGEAGLSIRDVKMADTDEKWVDVTIITTLIANVTAEDISSRLEGLKGIRLTSVDFT
ncbi:MAG: MgtC/SapB family protein [Clostridiales bacterium]|nr:MgtC/SapB family protein [Clostridiales bacterium]